MLRRLAPAVLAAVALFAGGCGQTPTNVNTQVTSFPTPTPVGLQTPSTNNIYLGAYVAPVNGSIKTLQIGTGWKAAMDMHYYAWSQLFPHLQESADLANGRFPIDSWDCGLSDAQIAAGVADPLITTRAQAIKAFGHTVFLRFFWDMNLPSGTAIPYSDQARTACYDPHTDNPDGTFSASNYIAAWNHVRQIFTQQGVNNVIWVWSVSASGVNPAPYYPGDSQVDWVGFDALDSQGAGLSASLSPGYAMVTQYNKPVLVGEAGTQTQNQAVYLGAAPAALQSSFPLVKGFIYFDSPFGATDYSLKSIGSQQAFSAMSQNPYMQAYGTP